MASTLAGLFINIYIHTHASTTIARSHNIPEFVSDTAALHTSTLKITKAQRTAACRMAFILAEISTHKTTLHNIGRLTYVCYSRDMLFKM